jgi:hypothetical protein
MDLDLKLPSQGGKLMQFAGDGFNFVQKESAPVDEHAGRMGVPPEVVYEKYAVTREPCWGCIHTFRKPEVRDKNPALDKLWDTYERNADSMSPPTLAKLLEEEFNRLVYEPSIKAKEPCIKWPAEVIARHLGGFHGLDRRSDLRNMLYMYNSAEKVLADSVVTVAPNDPEFKVNEKKLKLLMELGACKIKVWSLLQNTT